LAAAARLVAKHTYQVAGALKMQDLKLTDQCAGHEIARHEIAGHAKAKQKTSLNV